MCAMFDLGKNFVCAIFFSIFASENEGNVLFPSVFPYKNKYLHIVIDKETVKSLVGDFLKDGDVFLVDVNISADNEIVVEIDSDTSVDIDTCCDLNRYIENRLPRDVEDYSLEVGSSGLTSPFKMPRQYKKNIGNEIEVLSAGKKISGILKNVADDGFTLEVLSKQKGKKCAEEAFFKFSDIDYAKYNLKFK